ncbi:endonuclease/exonuclease/phosphatase family protein [Streptomyces sp. SR27]|uniref:endonuclease/exonuclease/phosphatase family protein n=1 Tax=Streptomyces sp. SR27 TaxID=3076630 RepID=UPI00295B2D11|nr:endonuclease/exonuclease/phosphatase family protein [Streptomyces sp. SR27]MDV9189352.1 endonuclease/exonuclease/phosphatase family protein [Streptomyces sp. SR27]
MTPIRPGPDTPARDTQRNEPPGATAPRAAALPLAPAVTAPKAAAPPLAPAVTVPNTPAPPLAPTATIPNPASPPPHRPPSPWTSRPRGTTTTICSAVLTLIIAGHDWLPDSPGRLGSLAETLLPWTALALPALLAAAILRRSPAATVALVVPITVWLAVFGGRLTDKSSPGGDLTVVSHNVHQDNPDPHGTARSLIASGANILALEELSPDTAPLYEQALAATYPYHFYDGTVGLWSQYPLRDTRPVPIMPWTRALRATVDTPRGPLAVYVAHLPSVRVTPAGFTAGARDEALDRLAADLRAERLRRVIVMGDLNGSTDDRALRPLTLDMTSAQATAGKGFGFTWPARFPVVRIDQILLKGMNATSAWTLPATTSDHLPVAARLSLSPETPESPRQRP